MYFIQLIEKIHGYFVFKNFIVDGSIVAIAAKNARMCWAVLKHGKGFKTPA